MRESMYFPWNKIPGQKISRLLNLYINDFSDDEYVLDPIRSPIPNPTHGFPIQTLR